MGIQLVILVVVGLVVVVGIFWLIRQRKLPQIPDLDKILGSEPPVTTGLPDARTEVPFLDDYNPISFRRLRLLPRTATGGFLLRPGLFELYAQSYCLQAGAYAPGGGDGHLYAPLKGPDADIVRSILRNSVQHLEISQEDVQTLLWAAIARTKFSDLSPELQLVAAQLLSPAEILSLNGGALGLIPEALLDKAIELLPPIVRQAVEVQAKLRRMLTEAHAAFEELERVAVLSGEPTPGEGSREVPLGRWSYHPSGFFIRYLPSGYSLMCIQISVPERFSIERDELGRMTMIADEHGNRIELCYDDAIEPVTVPGDPTVRGYAFRTIRFAHREVMGLEAVLKMEAEWENLGWTLVGSPSGEGEVESTQDRFSDLKARYDWAKTHKGQLLTLNEQLEKLRSPQYQTDMTIEDIVALGHISNALNKALKGDDIEKEFWVDEHADMVKQAWQYGISALAGGLEGGNLEYDPSEGIATPGNTSRQRLAPSERPSQEDENKKDCAEVKKYLAEDIMWRLAYGSEGLLELAEQVGADGFQFWAAANELADIMVRHLGNKLYLEGGLNDPEAWLDRAYSMHELGAQKLNQKLIDILQPILQNRKWSPDAPESDPDVLERAGGLGLTDYGCYIHINDDALAALPAVLREATVVHERVHEADCLCACGGSRDIPMGKWQDVEGFFRSCKDPEYAREVEVRAYDESIRYLEDWLRQNCQ